MKFASSALVTIAILAPSLSLTAQETEPAPSSLAEEMSALNVTMKEIAALLEKHVAGQETDLLIKRVDLANRALISRREELGQARAEVTRLSEEVEPMRVNLEAWQEDMDRANVDDEVRKNMRFEMERAEKRLEPLEARRKELERQVIELENEVMAHEEDMRILEDVLDERLGLR
ncbi:MAG: hypothetical protein GY719_40335 [bacterium]|nr:hypothetical protein [bacterium]